MDKYTKFILTVIAIGIIALNVDIVTPVQAKWGLNSMGILEDGLADIASAIRELNLR